MYGKKRVVFNKRNRVIISGTNGKGGSHMPVGIYSKTKVANGVFAKILTPENRWDNKLTDENSVTFVFETLKEMRGVIGKLYDVENN